MSAPSVFFTSLPCLGELFEFGAVCGDLLQQFVGGMLAKCRCAVNPHRSLPLEPPVCFSLPGRCDRPAEPGLIHRLRFANRRSQSRNAASQFAPQSRPPIIAGTTLEEGWAMNEQEDRLAREREEIAARVASFKATQQKFEREREEYYATTLGNAWSGFNRPSFWT